MHTLIAMLLGFPIALYRALVVTIAWGWFIVPSFGIAAPSIIATWGILCLITLVFPGAISDAMVFVSKEKNEFSAYGGPVVSLVITSFSFFIMWLLQLFM